MVLSPPAASKFTNRSVRNGGLCKNSNEPSKNSPRFPQQTEYRNVNKRLRIWLRCPQSVAARPAPVESRTSLALQEMFEAHQPSAWYFGHFHINREFATGEPKFRCSAEMAAFEVVSCDSSVVMIPCAELR